MSSSATIDYWEARAQRFARHGAGLRAVCSYGMPWFYNSFIHCTQWLALRRWLKGTPGRSALDVGCGVGRWSRMLARQGADVTGVDLAPTMIEEAGRRTRGSGLNARFLVADLTTLSLARKFDLIVGVTVLQHIMDEQDVNAAMQRLRDHLESGGRLVLLEAAPSRSTSRCNTPIFRARTAEQYRALFHGNGLRVVAETGVDPAPFKTIYLPYHRRLPGLLGSVALFAATLLSLPIDLILGRLLSHASWHKVFVLEHRDAR
jgi:2-polyprenyl-3-methyl-5-hydroxy-6-metoxy-1,4-benzoquinol methylase